MLACSSSASHRSCRSAAPRSLDRCPRISSADPFKPVASQPCVGGLPPPPVLLRQQLEPTCIHLARSRLVKLLRLFGVKCPFPAGASGRVGSLKSWPLRLRFCLQHLIFHTVQPLHVLVHLYLLLVQPSFVPVHPLPLLSGHSVPAPPATAATASACCLTCSCNCPSTSARAPDCCSKPRVR